MEYKIIRSKRRTISLIVDEVGDLIVRAPIKVTDSYLTELISKKMNWILKKQNEVLKKGKFKEKEFVDGEEFLYLGSKYFLKISDCSKIELDEYLFFPKKYLKKAKAEITKWYRKEALNVFEERIKIYSKMTGWKYTSLALSNAKRQWGVCDDKNRIKLNWRLVMAPLEIIDYVVVHELAHTKEHNHSKKFWNLVDSIIANHKMKRKWLKDNSKYLNI